MKVKRNNGAPDGTGDSPLYHVNLDMVFVFEKEEDVTICHLYDDRGFQIFFVN